MVAPQVVRVEELGGIMANALQEHIASRVVCQEICHVVDLSINGDLDREKKSKLK